MARATRAGGELPSERGKVEALLMLLEARGLALSEEERAEVVGCGDVNLVNQWIVRAATARSVAEVLATPRAPAKARGAARKGPARGGR